MAIRLNEDKELVAQIREGLRRRGGYCPCRLERPRTTSASARNSASRCQDPDFEGYCHCMLYYKTKDPIKEEPSHAEDHSDQL